MSPLYRKLLLWFCAANIAVLLVSVFVTDRIGRHVNGNEPEWDTLARETLARYESEGLLGLAAHADTLRREQGLVVSLYRDGRDLLLRRQPPPLRPFLPQLLAADSLVLRPGKDLWLASRAVTASNGEALHFIALRGPPRQHTRRDLLLLVQVALSLVVIAALGFVLARSLTAPITAIQNATRRMAEGDLAARADAPTTARRDELGALARDFNHMAARTEALVRQQRTVLQDVSHELRSPLARLHLLLELARQGASEGGGHQLDRAAREVSRLDDLIGEVLNLSRLETVLPGMTTVPVELATLVRDVLDEHAIETDARGIDIEVSAGSACVNGDAALLARALGNVVGNAIKFSPEGSRIVVAVSSADGLACIRVRDHGPGVPPSQLPLLFQPFYRGDNAARAEGHGLGLAIASRIVAAHGGEITAANAADGGLDVRITLPTAKG